MMEDSPGPDVARYAEIARRFLHTAVVVDDEARLQREQPTPLQTPDRRNRPDVSERADPEPIRRRSLDAAALSQAFAERGVVCGVLVPAPHDPITDAVVQAAARADVVILDWQIDDDDGAQALEILAKLRTHDSERGERVRLIVIYTGEPNLPEILGRIHEAMPEDVQVEETRLRLRYRNIRVMLFGKDPAILTEKHRALAFEETALPSALFRAWMQMDAGLLPSLALLSLTAVRENAHAVVGKFKRELDPAFMTHRACLFDPGDAEQHIVDQVASELHAVMSSQVLAHSEEYRETLGARLGNLWGSRQRVNGDRIHRTDAIQAVVKGKKTVPQLRQAAIGDLTRIFSGGALVPGKAEEMDLAFTWLMTARALHAGQDRTLHLGVVVEEEASNGQMLICLMPRCDSIRLAGPTRFLFARLMVPGKSSPQIVVRRNGEYVRMVVERKVGDWQQVQFSPNARREIAAIEDDTGQWWFTSSDNNVRRFRWLGELRMEWAQHLAHTLGTRITGVAVNTPEWLRRQER